MKPNPSQAQISSVMAAMGRRNKGKPKTMSPEAKRQRKNAGIASAKARGFKTRKNALLSPASRPEKPPPPRRTSPLRKHGKKGLQTYPREKTDPLLMGCGGKGKPQRVIDGDRLMEYVGIGWIEERKATVEDKKLFPTLI